MAHTLCARRLWARGKPRNLSACVHRPGTRVAPHWPFHPPNPPVSPPIPKEGIPPARTWAVPVPQVKEMLAKVQGASGTALAEVARLKGVVEQRDEEIVTLQEEVASMHMSLEVRVAVRADALRLPLVMQRPHVRSPARRRRRPRRNARRCKRRRSASEWRSSWRRGSRLSWRMHGATSERRWTGAVWKSELHPRRRSPKHSSQTR